VLTYQNQGYIFEFTPGLITKIKTIKKLAYAALTLCHKRSFEMSTHDIHT